MNLGFGEILVLLIVGLVVFGPNKLPEIARNLGKAMRSFQSESRRVLDELNDTRTTIGVLDRPDAPPSPPRPPAPPQPAAEPHPAAQPAATPPAEASIFEDT